MCRAANGWMCSRVLRKVSSPWYDLAMMVDPLLRNSLKAVQLELVSERLKQRNTIKIEGRQKQASVLSIVLSCKAQVLAEDF